MGRLPALLVVLLASACAGGDDTATETVTVTTATTVTVAGTTTQPTTTTAAPPGSWNGLPEPLPADGTLPVDAFNAYAESVDERWERDLAATTERFIALDTLDKLEAPSRSFQATSSGAGATASLLLDGLQDDSIKARRYDLTLSRRQDGTWRIDSAQWSQRCQEGRGHQTFSPALCL